MKKQSHQMVAYSAWESKRTVQYEELKLKYAAIKEQENAVNQQKESKKSKKDQLLDLKLRGTLSKGGAVELNYINDEERVKSTYDDDIKHITERRDDEISQADKTYESAMEKARREYDAIVAKIQDKYEIQKEKSHSAYYRAKGAYDKQLEKSIDKVNRVYHAKKQMLDDRKEMIDGEKSITSKTAAELSIEKQKRAILKEMEEIIDGMHMARSQIPEKERDFLFDVPELPEPILDAHKPTPVTPAPKPKRVISEDQWMSYGEDASLAQMREMARMEKSVRPEYDIRPNPTPYGLIGTAKDVDKLYTKPAYVPEEEEKPQVDDDEYDEEYIAERKAEFRELWSVPV